MKCVGLPTLVYLSIVVCLSTRERDSEDVVGAQGTCGGDDGECDTSKPLESGVYTRDQGTLLYRHQFKTFVIFRNCFEHHKILDCLRNNVLDIIS